MTPHPTLVYINQKKGALSAALPTSLRALMTLESIIQAVGLALDESDALSQATPESVYSCVLRATRLGLDLSNGEAFLVPFNKKADNRWIKTCTLIVGQQGKIALALRTGLYDGIVTGVVYEHDDWMLDQASRRLTHCPRMQGDRGDPLFGYARAWLKGQPVEWPGFQEIMLAADFEKIEATAKEKNRGRLSPAYAEWRDEMWRRSVLSRMLKRAPKSRDLAEILNDETELYRAAPPTPVEAVRKQLAEPVPDFSSYEPDGRADEPERVVVAPDEPPGAAHDDAFDAAFADGDLP